MHRHHRRRSGQITSSPSPSPPCWASRQSAGAGSYLKALWILRGQRPVFLRCLFPALPADHPRHAVSMEVVVVIASVPLFEPAVFAHVIGDEITPVLGFNALDLHPFPSFIAATTAGRASQGSHFSHQSRPARRRRY